MDESCEPLSCQPPIFPNGKLVPQTSTMLHAVAAIICDHGYLLDSGLRVSFCDIQLSCRSEVSNLCEGAEHLLIKKIVNTLMAYTSGTPRIYYNYKKLNVTL